MKKITVFFLIVWFQVLGFAYAATPEKWDEEIDVLVVGAGGAGLSAALSASENGASVILIEKQPFIGGNTLISGGFYNAPGTEIQKTQNIPDSSELFYKQMLSSGKGKNSERLIKVLAEESLDTLTWLIKYGVHFQDKVYQIYGSIYPRCHKPILPRGTAYVQALSQACLANRVLIRTGTQLTKIFRGDDGIVVGAEVQSDGIAKTIRTKKGVALAAGGFGANKEKVKKYAPNLGAHYTDSAPGSTGEVLDIAQTVGAQLVNMEIVEVVPEGTTEIGLSARIYMLIKGVAFVNSEGKRFVDEGASRSEIAKALRTQNTEQCFTIADNQNVQSLDKMQLKNLYRSLFDGQVWKADTIEDLARQTGLPVENLKQSIAEIPENVRPKNGPFWAVKIYPWIHYTLGGIKINEKTECLDANDQPIEGLFAAGQITGNVHGENRLGGNGLTDAIVFGRIAGRNAAKMRSTIN